MTAKQDLIDKLSHDIVRLLDDDEVMDAIDELAVEAGFAGTYDQDKYDEFTAVTTREVTGRALIAALELILMGVPNP